MRQKRIVLFVYPRVYIQVKDFERKHENEGQKHNNSINLFKNLFIKVVKICDFIPDAGLKKMFWNYKTNCPVFVRQNWTKWQLLKEIRSVQTIN
jgi:hypothetical protein